AIMYISHHLEEVFEICTDVAVLRDGELVLTAPVTEMTKDGLVTAMVEEKKKDHYAERAVVQAPAPGLAPPESRGRPGAADLVVSSVTMASTGVRPFRVFLSVRRGRGGGRAGAGAPRG